MYKCNQSSVTLLYCFNLPHISNFLYWKVLLYWTFQQWNSMILPIYILKFAWTFSHFSILSQVAHGIMSRVGMQSAYRVLNKPYLVNLWTALPALLPGWGTNTACLAKSACTACTPFLGGGANAACLGMSTCTPSWWGVMLPAWELAPALPALLLPGNEGLLWKNLDSVDNACMGSFWCTIQAW